MPVSFIFLDFGGCIDAPGLHTRTLFFDAFVAEDYPQSDRPRFQDAYTGADRRMMETGEAKEMGLRAFNRHNAGLIAAPLGFSPERAAAAGDRVTELMHGYLEESRAALTELRRLAALGIISNFTGNLPVILREYKLDQFFDSVTESFYAGVSKPDPTIFKLALATQKHPPAACLYVGDNPVNDIAPARALGLRTVLIHPPGQKKDCEADGYIEALRELPRWIQSA